MENSKKDFGQSSIAFEKPGILCEKLITTNYHKIEYFLLKFCTHLPFYLPVSVKTCFLVLFRSYAIRKADDHPVSKHPQNQFFYVFIKNSRSNQNKNDLEHPFVDTVK